MLLQFRFLGNERVLEFFELLKIQRAVGKGVIDPINLGFDNHEVGFEPVNLCLLFVRSLGFPSLDSGKKVLVFKEKGVDVKIAVDMVSLACDKKVKEIILGDSASLATREVL